MNSVQTNGYNKGVLHSNIQKLRKAQKIHHLTDANFNDSIYKLGRLVTALLRPEISTCVEIHFSITN